MLATVHAGTLVGTDAQGVIVEVHLGRGLPGFDIVGLAETAVRESRVRVRAAITSAGFELPQKHVVLGLAPADVKKSGSALDLAIAVAVLAAQGVCAPNALGDTLLVGELSLSGELRAVRGVLAQLRSARARGLASAIVPRASAAEAALAVGLDVRTAATLAEVVAHLDGREELPRVVPEVPGTSAEPVRGEDLSDVRGQASAKRAMEVAAAGGHHLLFVGPPGTGKTMLARRLRGLMPAPTPDEALEIATIAGVAGLPWAGSGVRPFRAPHHTASDVALVGGGEPVRPGEVTLAHGGVLFLDELPEFRRSAIESLRTTMELGEAAVARARSRVTMPARPLVVAAMNPCPCGFAGDKKRICTCSPDRIERYRGRLSGPLLDRFDLHVALPPVPTAALRAVTGGERSDVVRERIEASRAFAAGRGPARRPSDVLATLAEGTRPEALALLDAAAERLRLSARAQVKVLRVARTIADLGGSVNVDASHVAEAVQYRLLDRAPPPSPGARAPERQLS